MKKKRHSRRNRRRNRGWPKGSHPQSVCPDCEPGHRVNRTCQRSQVNPSKSGHTQTGCHHNSRKKHKAGGRPEKLSRHVCLGRRCLRTKDRVLDSLHSLHQRGRRQSSGSSRRYSALAAESRGRDSMYLLYLPEHSSLHYQHPLPPIYGQPLRDCRADHYETGRLCPLRTQHRQIATHLRTTSRSHEHHDIVAARRGIPSFPCTTRPFG